jgi:GntR family transcriptional regulator/MocR family aminotransferase
VLCIGVTSGLVRVCRRLHRAGIRAVAVEDPGWTWLWQAIWGAGLRVVPIRVDEHGLRVEDLDALREVRAVLVTPANQFPTRIHPRARATRGAARLGSKG